MLIDNSLYEKSKINWTELEQMTLFVGKESKLPLCDMKFLLAQIRNEWFHMDF